MPAATTKTQLSKLREPFPVEQVKQRPGGRGMMLDYVPIETVLERLLTVAPEYSIENASSHLLGDNVAVASLELVIGDKRGFGVGAMKNPDPDMALKSAVSEAIKNAAKNGFGVALELWDQEHREELEAQRQGGQVVPLPTADDELTQLKNRVADLAVAAGVERTGPAIASHFNIPIEQLQDRETLERLVESAAVASI
jgi:hypothetical protein